MPFTFSHPAIVLPFIKSSRLSATGLIVGSMCPDFEYFIRMKVQSNISHTLLGLFIFNIPISLLAALLFHQIIKKGLIENSPSFFSSRLDDLKKRDWMDYLRNNFIIVVLSIVIGAISHILWDGFTHQTGYFVTEFPFLLSKIYAIPLYKILQHLSSCIGMATLFFYLYKMPSSNIIHDRVKKRYWVFVLFCISLIMAIRFCIGLSFVQYGNVIVSLISSTIIGIAISSFWFKKLL
nr:DUF4184 family protein [uncultured Flavobacterium sp.]